MLGTPTGALILELMLKRVVLQSVCKICVCNVLTQMRIKDPGSRMNGCHELPFLFYKSTTDDEEGLKPNAIRVISFTFTQLYKSHEKLITQEWNVRRT